MRVARVGCVLSVLLAAACGDNSPLPVTVGGTITGLDGAGLVLLNNGGDALAVSSDGRFVFAEPIEAAKAYAVTVQSHPTEPTQTCTVANGSGIAGAAGVHDIVITCQTGAFTVAGTVSGLTGDGLVLQNNGTDDLAIADDGTFVFAKPLLSGTTFAVTVAGQPSLPTQTCTVAGASGVIGAGPVTTVVVDCATDRFAVGGMVSGLDGTVVLQNGSEQITVTANGGFAFANTVPSGDAYDVTIVSQPASPISQTCTLASAAGTVVDADISAIRLVCTTNTFAVGGTVTGLAGAGLVLQNNAGETLPVTTAGTFAFGAPVASGEAYAVTVLAQPTNPSQHCEVGSGSGTIGGAAIEDVQVTCSTRTFAVGGTVTGLSGGGLVLQNNAGDNLPIAADGSFTFPTAVASGAAYAVTVLTQPTGPSQTCAVVAGTGTVGAGPVSAVTVNCATDHFVVGGTVSGLDGTLVLANQGGDAITVTSNGTFAFPTTVASGAGYAITVATQPQSPISQTCTVANGTGTVGGSDVSSVAITCTTNRFMVIGAVTGLAGQGLVLQNNGANDQPLTSDGPFTFTDAIRAAARTPSRSRRSPRTRARPAR